eukprot:934371-Amphidinium_carterae.1
MYCSSPRTSPLLRTARSTRYLGNSGTYYKPSHAQLSQYCHESRDNDDDDGNVCNDFVPWVMKPPTA